MPPSTIPTQRSPHATRRITVSAEVRSLMFCATAEANATEVMMNRIAAKSKFPREDVKNVNRNTEARPPAAAKSGMARPRLKENRRRFILFSFQRPNGCQSLHTSFVQQFGAQP